ncbi:MAG: DUF6361 family protein [Actinomycetota bacterium]
MFREEGSVDEIGVGVIRDAFADMFFPGTSTIQTRAPVLPSARSSSRRFVFGLAAVKS